MSSGSVAAGYGCAVTSTHGGGASGVGRRFGPAGLPGFSGHGRGRDRGRGTVTVTVGSKSRTLGSALSTGAPGSHGIAPAHGDAMQQDDDDDDHDNYDNDTSSADDDEDNLEGADAPPEEEDAESRKNCLLSSVVCTNDDYGLGAFVQLPDPSPKPPAVFGAMELQALTFFVSCSVVRAGGFHKGDPSICAYCLR